MDARRAADGAVVVWQQPDRLWRWRWTQRVADGQQATLVSHQAFQSEEEALDSARAAYPGVPVQRPRPTATKQSRSRGYLLLVVSLAVGLMVLRHVRRRRRCGEPRMAPGTAWARGGPAV